MKHFLKLFVIILGFHQFNITLSQHIKYQQNVCCRDLLEIHCNNQKIAWRGCETSCQKIHGDPEYWIVKFCHEIEHYIKYTDGCFVDRCQLTPQYIYEINYIYQQTVPQSIPNFPQTNKPIVSKPTSTSTSKPKIVATLLTKLQRVNDRSTVQASSSTILSTVQPHKNRISQVAIASSSANHESKSSTALITIIVILLVVNFILIGYNSKKILKKIQQNLANQNQGSQMNGQAQTEQANLQIPPQLPANPNFNGELNSNHDPIYATLNWNR